jgi:hypothetical protein
MRFAIGLALLAVAAPAAAQLPPGLCHDLRMVIDSARQREPFARVTHHANWARFRLIAMCRPNRLGPVDRVQCSWRLPSAEPVGEAMAAEAARCLPRARRAGAGAVPLAPGEVRFVLDGMGIYIDQSIAAPGMFADSAGLTVILNDAD